MKNFIQKLLKIKAIKVLLCVKENFIKLISPKLWIWIENKLYNPYDFDEENIKRSKYQYGLVQKYADKYNVNLDKAQVFEIWPWGFLGLWAFLQKNWVQKYYVLDNINHFDLTQKNIDLYNKINPNFLKNNKIDPDYTKVLSYNKDNDILIETESTDVVFSNAVFEHIHDITKAIDEIYRITKKWWISIHTIDYRDHIFDQQKLWFLRFPQFWFDALFYRAGARTNRKKHFFYRDYFEKLGFEILETITNTKPEYTEEEIQRYPDLLKKYDKEDLRISTCLFVLRKI